MVSVLVSHSVRDAPTFADRSKDVSESPVLQVCTKLSVSEQFKDSQQALCCLRRGVTSFLKKLPALDCATAKSGALQRSTHLCSLANHGKHRTDFLYPKRALCILCRSGQRMRPRALSGERLRVSTKLKPKKQTKALVSEQTKNPLQNQPKKHKPKPSSVSRPKVLYKQKAAGKVLFSQQHFPALQ